MSALSSAFNIYSFKPEHRWPELLLYARLRDVIAEISNHGFHSRGDAGCAFCAVLTANQERNREYLLLHHERRIQGAVAETLDPLSRLLLALKTAELYSVWVLALSYLFVFVIRC